MMEAQAAAEKAAQQQAERVRSLESELAKIQALKEKNQTEFAQQMQALASETDGASKWKSAAAKAEARAESAAEKQAEAATRATAWETELAKLRERSDKQLAEWRRKETLFQAQTEAAKVESARSLAAEAEKTRAVTAAAERAAAHQEAVCVCACVSRRVVACLNQYDCTRLGSEASLLCARVCQQQRDDL